MTGDTYDENLMASGDYLEAIRNFALLKGISYEALLEGSELTYDDLVNPPEFMPNFISSNIGLNLYKHLPNPVSGAAEFGLCMTASSHGSLGIAVQSVATVREAYQVLQAFYHTRHKGQNIYLNECQDGLTITLSEHYKNEDLDEDIKRFFDLAILVSIVANNHQAPYQSNPRDRLHLFIDAPEPADFPFKQLNGTEIKFNSPERKLFVPKVWLDAPLSLANPSIAQAALERCEQELERLSPKDLVARIEKYLTEADERLPTLREIADKLHMSQATLKRKLKEHSTTYQDIKNKARLSKACSLIKLEKYNSEELAMKLGFSDASNFVKAFKRWTGKTPKQFRDEFLR